LEELFVFHFGIKYKSPLLIYLFKIGRRSIFFNPKTEEISWVSEEPLFEDPDATTITFASDFIQTSKNFGILYCHVNDSFVRGYKVNLKGLRKLLPIDF